MSAFSSKLCRIDAILALLKGNSFPIVSKPLRSIPWKSNCPEKPSNKRHCSSAAEIRRCFLYVCNAGMVLLLKHTGCRRKYIRIDTGNLKTITILVLHYSCNCFFLLIWLHTFPSAPHINFDIFYAVFSQSFEKSTVGFIVSLPLL